GLALAGEPDACAVLDPGWDVDVERALLAHAALAAAGAARPLDDLAGPVAGRAGALDREEALGRAHLPVAAAGLARRGLGAGIAGTLAAAAFERGVAEAVVGGALLLVLEDLVGFADVLELLLGRLVARVAVRVMLHGELAIGPLELVAARPPVHAEQFVVIL